MTHSGYILCDYTFWVFYIVKSVRDCTRSQTHQPGLRGALTALTFEVTTESKTDKASWSNMRRFWGKRGCLVLYLRNIIYCRDNALKVQKKKDYTCLVF